MKKYLALLFLFLLIAQASALTYEEYGLEELKTSYNNNLGKVPWIVKQIIGNERINVYITMNNQEVITVSGTTQNAKIISAQEGLIEDPTLNIYVTENTINRLRSKEITVQQAIETKEIKYESQRITTSIKTWFARRILKYF
jgi:hypothetical protein